MEARLFVPLGEDSASVHPSLHKSASFHSPELATEEVNAGGSSKKGKEKAKDKKESGKRSRLFGWFGSKEGGSEPVSEKIMLECYRACGLLLG